MMASVFQRPCSGKNDQTLDVSHIHIGISLQVACKDEQKQNEKQSNIIAIFCNIVGVEQPKALGTKIYSMLLIWLEGKRGREREKGKGT